MDFDIERIARSPFTVGAVGTLITATEWIISGTGLT